MRYYAQAQAPAGNYTDIMGSDEQAGCDSFAEWYSTKYGVSTRTIERVDTVLLDWEV